ERERVKPRMGKKHSHHESRTGGKRRAAQSAGTDFLARASKKGTERFALFRRTQIRRAKASQTTGGKKHSRHERRTGDKRRAPQARGDIFPALPRCFPAALCAAKKL
ncbi:MAG: hypothetical protein PUK79_10120, partial [Clostridiales bacterium]|nr:hypothetical protein [Clostridiales bacterium]